MNRKVIGVILGAIAAATGGVYMLREGETPVQGVYQQASTREYKKTATTTESGEPFFFFNIVPEHPKQGVCLIVKDASGEGFTYLTAEDGVLKANATGCSL